MTVFKSVIWSSGSWFVHRGDIFLSFHRNQTNGGISDEIIIVQLFFLFYQPNVVNKTTP